MSLAAGVRLGPYEIQSLLGAGGMGEVYRARDTRLDRTVAVKLLPPALSADPDRRARFEREAHTIAQLAHPHICTLYDVGTHDGATYLVMEHLSGDTLATRIAKGPVPVAQVLEIGAQIADALAAAHKQGIVHRDLKPANVMLVRAPSGPPGSDANRGSGPSPERRGGPSGPPFVKLLDFGLAKLHAHGETPAVAMTTATAAPSLTARGTILGTLPYMAPEQVQGQETDARTDLWALGAILYEMLTGKRAFEASSAVSLVGAILEREPAPINTRQPLTPPGLDRVVRRCLAKHPDDRWDTAHDVAGELRWIAQTAGAEVFPAVGKASLRQRMLLATVLVALAFASALAGRWSTPAVPRPSVVRSLLDVRPAEELDGGMVSTSTWFRTPGGSRLALAWTPDGRSLVFVGRRNGVQRLYVRALDGEEARVLEGTEGAEMPAVSPDGQSVVFWARDAIRRLPLAGGPPAVVAEWMQGLPPMGMACGDGGRVFYADGAIWSVLPEHAPTPVTKTRDGEHRHLLPHVLPGGRALLYTVSHRWWTWGDEEVVAQVIATGERKALLRDAVDARYVAPGFLVFLRRGVLSAVRFNLERLEVQGTPVAVVEAVAQALTGGHGYDLTGAGQFAVGPTGALVYVSGAVVPSPDARIVSVDRQGRVSPLDAPTRSYRGDISVSPDGRRLAVSIQSLTSLGLWLYDRERSTLSKLTPNGEVEWPRWTPDGQHVVFGWLDKGIMQLAWQRADGTSAPEVLPGDVVVPSSWSPDGRHLAGVNDGDIWIATVEKGKAPAKPLARTPDGEYSPEFSPDGSWLAYGSNASDRFEVYVQPYPGPGPRQQVSLGGGESPAWSPTGRELFFLQSNPEGGAQMMVVDVRLRPTLMLGRPRRLFEYTPASYLSFRCLFVRCYAVAPDGQRFYVTQAVPTPPSPPVTHIRLVENWIEELKAKVASDPGPR